MSESILHVLISAKRYVKPNRVEFKVYESGRYAGSTDISFWEDDKDGHISAYSSRRDYTEGARKLWAHYIALGMYSLK
jgi:hypothetical protein